MNNKENTYDNNSIKSLKGADRVRLRPSVIFGSDGIVGCQHSVFEILSNAIDEARHGFGETIEVYRYKDKSIKIVDHARGIPVDYNEKEKKYNWELLFCELYAGGKYDDDDNYSFSLGLNGLGLCATQYSSEFMGVTVKRDGYIYTLHFEKGENIGNFHKETYDKEDTGTTIVWRPDRDVFTDIDIPFEYFADVLKRQAVANKNILFKFYDEESEQELEFFYERGISDYIEEISLEKNFTDIVYFQNESFGKDREDKPEYKVKFEMVFCFNNEVTLTEYYHNSSFLEYGGSPDKAVKSGFLYAIDNYIKQNNLYKKNEKKITFQDIEDSLIIIVNSFSTITSYENQTKKSITNKFIQETITDFLKTNLEIYFIENKSDVEKIVNQVLVNKRSRETAENTRINIRKKLTNTNTITNRVEKFVDCRTKDTDKRELYIVEGDSALGSCKLGRDSDFQAIMPVRGKILNCLKADYNKIFQNDIILDLLRVLGCGVEISTKHNKDLSTFNLNDLRWRRVIICTDADVDGFQIRTLILTMLYRLVPTLIKEGKVFIAESPLYEITAGTKTYFAYSEIEKSKILNKIKTKYTIQRSKGLGENEPDMMWQTTMNPETRKLIQVVPEDVEETQKVFDLLLGNDLSGRKQYIVDSGHEYLDSLDVL